MFVGTTNLDTEFLRTNYKNPTKIRKYSNSLIPEEFSENSKLKDNQLYFVCLTMRKLGITDYDGLRETIRVLFKGLRVTGYVDSVLEISSVYSYINREKLERYIRRL